MAKKKPPVTPATRVLKQAGVDFSHHLYDYQERGGTSVSSRELGVDEHQVIKTLVFEDDRKRPLIVLMHGDLQVSGRALARALGVRSAEPCDPSVAEKHTGYKVGGTSPFGLRKPLPIYAEASIARLDRVYLNGGSRGYLVGLQPQVLQHLLQPTWVEVARTR
jgi:Cys-tRNA(Pro) deacylase